MKIRNYFHNSFINFRSLSKINVYNKFQLFLSKRFKSLIAYFLIFYLILSRIKIITLKNLLIIKKVQLYSFNKNNDFESAKMKSIIKI